MIHLASYGYPSYWYSSEQHQLYRVVPDGAGLRPAGPAKDLDEALAQCARDKAMGFA